MIAKQNYVSSELTHFVGRNQKNDDEKYALLIKIIKSGLLVGRVDNGKGSTMVQVDPNLDFSTNESYNINMVCFCDIPVVDFDIHMSKYSKFGISFTKDFLVRKGTRPVCYIPRDAGGVYGSVSDLFNKNVRLLSNMQYDLVMKSINKIISIKGENIENQFNGLDIFQFIDMQLLSFIKFFDDDKYDDDPDNYYMEREWRCLERIEFQLQDIKRIILPSAYIRKFFNDIPEYNNHITTV